MESLQTQNFDRTITVIDCMKKAAQAKHTISIANLKRQKVYEAINSNSKEIMWYTLQQYIAQYGSFINSLASFTNLCVVGVDKDFYETLTVNDLRLQLNEIIGFIYAKEALNSVAKETFKQAFITQLRKMNILNDAQLKVLSALL